MNLLGHLLPPLRFLVLLAVLFAGGNFLLFLDPEDASWIPHWVVGELTADPPYLPVTGARWGTGLIAFPEGARTALSFVLYGLIPFWILMEKLVSGHREHHRRSEVLAERTQPRDPFRMKTRPPGESPPPRPAAPPPAPTPDPISGQARLDRALGMVYLGGTREALPLLEELCDPGHGVRDQALTHRAMIHALRGDQDSARALLRETDTRRIPPDLRFQAGVSLLRAEMHEEALPLLSSLDSEGRLYPELKELVAQASKHEPEKPVGTAKESIAEWLDPRYRVIEVLGRGGMGTVLKARDLEAGRDVAVKVLHMARTGKTEATARFLREAKALQQLDHPNIVKALQVHKDPVPHFSMELVIGVTLEDRILARTPLSEEEMRRIVGDMLRALDYCHGRQVVHRDVKPSNILLQDRGPAKLSDFGVVKVQSATTITSYGAVLGTLAYMAPEQVRAGVIDGRSDLFSLAVVTYELLAGQLPYQLSGELILQIAEGKTQPLATHRPEIDPELGAFMEKALAPDPADRFQSAAEMLAALETAWKV